MANFFVVVVFVVFVLLYFILYVNFFILFFFFQGWGRGLVSVCVCVFLWGNRLPCIGCVIKHRFLTIWVGLSVGPVKHMFKDTVNPRMAFFS